MSAQPVNFEFKNGVKSVINKTVAETLEARGEGKIVKGTPEPPVPFVKPGEKTK